MLSSVVYFQQSTSHHATFPTAQSPILCLAYLYQKDERVLPDNLQNSKLWFSNNNNNNNNNDNNNNNNNTVPLTDPSVSSIYS
jgi:hypothetical protein